MTQLIKPMLSGTVTDPAALRYPVLVSPKLDGYRASVQGGVVLSRNLKPIPNAHVQAAFGGSRYEGLDGELIVGDPAAPDAFYTTASGVTRREGTPDVRLYAFDVVTRLTSIPFTQRLDFARLLCSDGAINANLLLVDHVMVHSAKDLAAAEEVALATGYEGVMIRDPRGPYKQGRSTEREGWLLKLKRFEDAEAEVLDYEERQHNANAATRDALGHVKRSAHKANKHGTGTMGALLVRGLNGAYKGRVFSVGTGWTDAERAALWLERESLPGRALKYKFFPLGSKEAPRFPTFLAFINREDVPE